MALPKGISRDDIKAWYRAFELWFTKSSRIAVVMARGAYWLGERKRLAAHLGLKAFEQIKEGKQDLSTLEPLVTQLQRIDERLDAEERLVQEIRGDISNEDRLDT